MHKIKDEHSILYNFHKQKATSLVICSILHNEMNRGLEFYNYTRN